MMDLDVDNVFVISTGNGSDNGGFGYSGEGNFFDVVINNSSVATLGHEMKHGFQYLEGKVDFQIKEGKVSRGSLSGIEDEFDAFNRASLLGAPKYSESQIERTYLQEGYNYGGKSLGEKNIKQLYKYMNDAENGKRKYKYNTGFQNYIP